MDRVSIIIPWSNRDELATTLQENMQIFLKHSPEIIVVNCGGDQYRLDNIIKTIEFPVRCLYTDSPTFNKSLAINLGVYMSRHNALFLLDSDIILKTDILREAAAILSDANYIKIRKVYESKPETNPRIPRFLREEVLTREVTCTNGRRAVMYFFAGGDGSHCGSGLLLMKKPLFVQVGGFNSALQGWGFEDIDFQLRLQFVLRVQQVPLGEVIHLSHSDLFRNVRNKSKQEDWNKNMAICYQNYENEIFNGTYSNDNQTWRTQMIESQPQILAMNSLSTN